MAGKKKLDLSEFETPAKKSGEKALKRRMIEDTAKTGTEKDRVHNIPCILIHESPLNKEIPLTDLDELAESIRLYGQLTPAGVYEKEDGTYELYAGHRRLHAIRDILKEETIACITKPYTTDAGTRFGEHLDSNLQSREKDIPFWMAEIENALNLIRSDGKKRSIDAEMDEISEMFRRHGLKKGFSKAGIYRYYGLRKLTPALLDTYRYGLEAPTLYKAVNLTAAEQNTLAMQIGEYVKIHAGSSEDDIKFPTRLFQSNVDRLVAAREAPQARPGRKRRSYSEQLKEMQTSYIARLGAARTNDERREAEESIRRTIAALEGLLNTLKD